MKKVCIIDYGLGNLASIYNATKTLYSDVKISNSPTDILNASHLILPGVGSFKSGIEGLQKFNLMKILNEEVIKKKKKFLGICLGMQLILTESFEGGVFKGLNWINGKVLKISKKDNVMIPHMGWNDVKFSSSSSLYKGVQQNSAFYFVHSFHALPIDANLVSGICFHGSEIVASLEKENIFATQFHPEKSHDVGTQLLKNFIEN